MPLSEPDTPDHSPDLMAELHTILLTSDDPAWDAYVYASYVLKLDIKDASQWAKKRAPKW